MTHAKASLTGLGRLRLARGIGNVLVPLVVRRQAQKEMPTNVANLERNLES